MSSKVQIYRPHYSLSDYEQWSGDWELWDGTAVAMSPAPAPIHEVVSGNIAFELGREIRSSSCDCRVVQETDWNVDDSTVVRPDVAVICHGIPEKYIDYPPTLIAEVLSPSTKEKDRTAKKELYREQGVEFYLLVDPSNQTCEAFQLSEDTYLPMQVEEGKLTFRLANKCEIQCVVSAFFE